MNQRQALEAAQQAGVPKGDYITLQGKQQAEHPHLHSGQTPPMHVDAWKVSNNNGVLSAEKFHNPIQ